MPKLEWIPGNAQGGATVGYFVRIGDFLLDTNRVADEWFARVVESGGILGHYDFDADGRVVGHATLEAAQDAAERLAARLLRERIAADGRALGMIEGSEDG